jgi:hypothetical protein
VTAQQQKFVGSHTLPVIRPQWFVLPVILWSGSDDLDAGCRMNGTDLGPPCPHSQVVSTVLLTVSGSNIVNVIV